MRKAVKSWSGGPVLARDSNRPPPSYKSTGLQTGQMLRFAQCHIPEERNPQNAFHIIFVNCLFFLPKLQTEL